ncbi:MAG: hypothetical protein WA817_24295 [Candidatus Acidiferrum sp.]
MGAPARTLASIERSVRENGLRGSFAGGLEVAAREHANINPLPDYLIELQRLDAIEAEMQIAAAKGDTAAIRRLSAEKQSIELAQERRTEADLALLNARQVMAPEPGEEKRVEASAKALHRQIAVKNTERTKLLVALAKQPENENLLSRVEKIDEWLADVAPEVEALTAQQNRIAAWKKQQEESGELAKTQKETKRMAQERESDEKSMADLAGKVTQSWLELCAAIEAFQKIVVRRMTIAKFRLHYDVADSLRLRINRETRGAIVRDEGISGSFTISGRFNSPEDER